MWLKFLVFIHMGKCPYASTEHLPLAGTSEMTNILPLISDLIGIVLFYHCSQFRV